MQCDAIRPIKLFPGFRYAGRYVLSITPVAGLIFEWRIDWADSVLIKLNQRKKYKLALLLSGQKSRAFFWRAFFWRAFFWSSITALELCSHQCLWSGFIFPELEHLYKNVFTASFPKRSLRNLGCSFVSKKRTRSGSNVSSRVGKDQLHPKTLFEIWLNA